MQEALIVFALNLACSCIGTLKSLFVVKDIKSATVIFTSLDAVLNFTILKSVANGEGTYLMLAYVAGKTIGVILASLLENLIAIGTLEVSLYLSDADLVKAVLTRLKDLGFSVTSYKGLTPDYETRFMLEIQIPRKKFKLLKKSLMSLGVDIPTTAVRDLRSVSGKIEDRL